MINLWANLTVIKLTGDLTVSRCIQVNQIGVDTYLEFVKLRWDEISCRGMCLVGNLGGHDSDIGWTLFAFRKLTSIRTNLTSDMIFDISSATIVSWS